MTKNEAMIKANELRLGNWVKTPNQPFFRIDLFEYVSKGIGKFGQITDPKLHPLTWYLQDLEGIELSEDILLKAGRKANLKPRYDWDRHLIDDKYDSEFYSKKYDLDGVELNDYTPYFIGETIIGFNNGKYYFVEESINSCEESYLRAISIPLLFLHQLQNAFPFFAGEELNISL